MIRRRDCVKGLSALVILALSGCISTPKKPEIKGPRVSVMAYNMENVFDTKDNPLKNDEEYLPKAYKDSHPRIHSKCIAENSPRYVGGCLNNDWTEAKLDRKLRRLANVIKQVNDGKGPDILIAEEIENQAVLDRLRTEYLKDSGYKPAILLQGPDVRGINVGMLSRLPMIGQPKLHDIDFHPGPGLKPGHIRPSRGILEVTFELPDKTPLTVFGVHFPSQGGPTTLRRQAIAKLNELQAEEPKDRLVMAGGDFNITSRENARYKLVSKDIASHWDVSQLVGCAQCKGTIYYHRTDSWSFFDMILFRDVAASKWMLDPASVRIPHDSRFQVSRFGTPARFGSGDQPVGVSDHWPIYAELVKKEGIQ